MKQPVIITLFLANLSFAAQAQTHQQTSTNYQTSTATSINVTFGLNNTASDLVIVHLDWDNQSVDITSVADNNGNVYKKINGVTNWNGASYRADLWYTYNIKTTPNAKIKVTASLSGHPTSYSQIYISEYSGIASTIDPLDANSVNAGNSPVVTSGSSTTHYNNELVYGAAIGASGTLTKGAGYNQASNANSNIIEDKNVTAIGTYNATFASASGNWVAQMATFISTISTLPVTFSAFTSHCGNNATVLDWATASETDNNFFTVEGSPDGSSWQDIGEVRGAGNSGMTQSYSYTVTGPDNAFYRIRQTDLDGKSTYSWVLHSDNCMITVSAPAIYPNPGNGTSLTGTIGLRTNENYTLDVFDVLGHVMVHGLITQSPFQVNFPQTLPAGVYYARFASATSSTVTAFVVKH